MMMNSIYYLKVGRGPTLILLHSGGGSTAEWETCMPLFSSEYTAISYDRRGYGRSELPRDFAGDYFHEDVEDLHSLLGHLDVDEKVYLCGFSDGGTVAMLYAARHPERTAALVCEGAHAYVEERTIEGLRAVRAEYEGRARKKGRLQDHAVQSQLAWFQRWLSPGFRDWNIMNSLSRIACPTLVVQGVEDRFATADQAEAIAGAISHSDLWVVEGAGHRVHERFPEEFTRRVKDFFRR
jgi:pimeloyl-ACP methyl ester carboxylesterase